MVNQTRPFEFGFRTDALKVGLIILSFILVSSAKIDDGTTTTPSSPSNPRPVPPSLGPPTTESAAPPAPKPAGLEPSPARNVMIRIIEGVVIGVVVATASGAILKLIGA
jgi:hypothetical protein